MKLDSYLKGSFPSDVVDALLSAYSEIEGNFALKKWKASELDAGHFVEAARRMVEHRLFGKAPSLSAQLNSFSDGELKRYEQASGDESYRMLIPRALKSIYNIRNKRGVGHLGAVSPNEMDSTYILYTCKWVLAELVRLESGMTASETQAVVDSIVERRMEILWKHEGITRVLEDGLTAKEQVMVLLYDCSPQSEEELRMTIEYKNASNFKKILRDLHANRLLEYSSTKPIQITTKGLVHAEALILRARDAKTKRKAKKHKGR